MRKCCEKTREITINECIKQLGYLRKTDISLINEDMQNKIIRRQKIIELHKQGYTYGQIKKAMGIKWTNSIVHILKRWGKKNTIGGE